MSATIIDGLSVAEKIKDKLRLEVAEFKKEHGRDIGLAVVRVGDDPASAVYVKNKIAACESTGIKSFSYILPEQTTESQLLELVNTLNEQDSVNGILVQLPLPRHLDEQKILTSISPDKDVDGFCAVNSGKLLLGQKSIAACTPRGIIELIKQTNIAIEGKHAVVVGRSNIVGKPIAIMLLENNATVTICHSKTKNLAEITRQADILVVAIGRKEFVTGDMIKQGAVVIDVGMNRADKLYGDVNFEQAKEVAGFITPVPGGVGPMTIAMLLSNTVFAAKCALE